MKCVFSWDLRQIILKLRCPQHRLEEMAERMHLKLKNRDGHVRRFKVSKRATFLSTSVSSSSSSAAASDAYYGDPLHHPSVFRSTERQQIIDFIVRSKIRDGGAELDENTELGVYIVKRFPLHMHARLADIRHTWVTFWKREAPGHVPTPWSPLSTPLTVTVREWRAAVTHFAEGLLSQPLDSIAEYFGEAIAFYFAYTAFYTRCLVLQPP